MEETVDFYIIWFERSWGIVVHPKAVQLLQDSFFWDEYGTFVFGADEDQESYNTMSQAFKANPNVSFFKLLAQLDYSGPVKFADFYELDQQVINQRTQSEGYVFIQADYLILEFSIGQLQFQGRIEQGLKELAVNAIKRQKMPLFLSYFNETGRLDHLIKIEEVILKA